ncbi:hypothetical protein B0H12DRAFT_1238695 [Mycena haematopus]|nr:hypothetical protein B0H12DRAFT_1238695 [Mycena haematopus]
MTLRTSHDTTTRQLAQARANNTSFSKFDCSRSHTQSFTSMPLIRTCHTRLPSARELRRRKALAEITRIQNPIDQALAHFADPRYKDFRGDLYIVCRVIRIFDPTLQMYVDALEIKSGFSGNTSRRQFNYRDTCIDVDFIWFYRYKCNCVKLLERLVHLTLRALGAGIQTYACPGCGVNHREFYSYSAAGGVDGLCAIIEFWLEALGQPVERVTIDPIT